MRTLNYFERNINENLLVQLDELAPDVEIPLPGECRRNIVASKNLDALDVIEVLHVPWPRIVFGHNLVV
jgi:hypothetical protein